MRGQDQVGAALDHVQLRLERARRALEVRRRNDLEPPPQAKAVEYFRSLAPQTLPDAEWENATSNPVEFVAEEIIWNVDSAEGPAISFIELDFPPAGSAHVLWSDMRSGQVASGTLDGDVHVLEAADASAAEVDVDKPLTVLELGRCG